MGTMNTIATWIFLGVLLGTAGYVLDPSPAKGGLRAALLVGISGAVLGGGLATYLFSGTFQREWLLTLGLVLSGGLLLLLIHRTLFSEQQKF